MTQEQPLKVRRGEDFTLSGVVTDQAGATVNITSGTITMTVKNNLTDADSAKVFQKTGTGLGSAGQFTVTIEDADTISLDLRSRYYDIELTLSGLKSTVTFGKFILLPEVTKA